MDDAFFMRRRQAARDLLPVVDCLAHRQWPTPNCLCQRHPLEQFRYQVWDPRVGSHLVDRKNVGMIQSRRGFCFYFESLQPLRIRQDELRQDFDGHVALQPGIARAVYLAHAARPKGREYFILTESCARGQGHGCRNYSPGANCNLVEKRASRSGKSLDPACFQQPNQIHSPRAGQKQRRS